MKNHKVYKIYKSNNIINGKFLHTSEIISDWFYILFLKITFQFDKINFQLLLVKNNIKENDNDFYFIEIPKENTYWENEHQYRQLVRAFYQNKIYWCDVNSGGVTDNYILTKNINFPHKENCWKIYLSYPTINEFKIFINKD